MLEEDSKVNVYRLCVVLKGQKRKKRFARQWNSRGLHHQGEMVALGVVDGCGKDAWMQIVCGATGTRALGKLNKG